MQEITTLMLDADGVLNIGPHKGGGTTFPKNSHKWGEWEMQNIQSFGEYMKKYQLHSHLITGRSTLISGELLRLINAPSVFEHGNIILNPLSPEKPKHLIEVSGNLSITREDREVLEAFIAYEAIKLTDRLQAYFPAFELKMLTDNKHLWSIEIYPQGIRVVRAVRELAIEMLPKKVRAKLRHRCYKEMLSRGAYELMLPVSKRLALQVLVDAHGINLSRCLAIEDSWHSGYWLKDIASAGGIIASPANADQELKELVLQYGGYVAEKAYADGTKEILTRFVGPF